MVDVMAILNAAIFTPRKNGEWGLPVCFLSEPGTGKTSRIETYGRQWGWHTETLNPSTHGEGSFACVPVPVAGRITRPVADWIDSFEDGEGILVLDEFNTGPASIQGSMLALLCGGKIGAAKLPPRVRVVAIMNPEGCSTGGTPISIPIANRMGWIHWAPQSGEQAAAHFVSLATAVNETFPTAMDSAEFEARVLVKFMPRFLRIVKLIGRFFQRGSVVQASRKAVAQSWKNRCPDPDTLQGDCQPWPSDRTWEYAARAWASAEVHGLTIAERDAFVAGFIGKDAYGAFLAFLATADVPDPIEVLDGVTPFVHDQKRVDITLTVVGQCADYLIAHRSDAATEARSSVLWRILADVSAVHADIVKPVVDKLQSARIFGSDPTALQRVMGRMVPYKQV